MSFREGMIVKNPVFSLGLGIGPVLALSYRFDTAWITGFLSLLLILLGRASVRLVREAFPAAILWYVRITILTFWVALMEIILEAYLPDLRGSLGIYLPLLAVNTFLLEAIVLKEQDDQNEWYGSLLFGLVYLCTIASVGAFREIIGSGTLTVLVLPGWTLRYVILTKPLQPIRFFILPAGGLILYGYLKAGFRLVGLSSNRGRRGEES